MIFGSDHVNNNSYLLLNRLTIYSSWLLSDRQQTKLLIFIAYTKVTRLARSLVQLKVPDTMRIKRFHLLLELLKCEHFFHSIVVEEASWTKSTFYLKFIITHPRRYVGRRG